MRNKFFQSILVLLFAATVRAQPVFKLVQLNTAGTLATVLSPTEKNTITHLQVSGNIDASDIKIMKSSMPLLDTIDLSQTQIMAYSGSGGTSTTTSYPANTIPEQAFVQKTTLKSVVLPTGITAIGGYAFYMSYGILQINIPAQVSSIGDYAFYACGAFLNVDNTNATYMTEEGVLYNKNKTALYAYNFYKQGGHTIPNTVTIIKGGAFAYCDNLQSVVIPSSVKTIESYAFDVCTGLKTITIPSSVTSIGNYSFGHCSGLQTVYAERVNPATVQSSTFAAVAVDSCILFVPNGSENTYKAATGWNIFTKVNGYKVGVEDKLLSAVRIFPNPVTDKIFIDGVNENLSIEIYDLRGVKVVSKMICSQETITVSAFPAGNYLIKLTTNDNQTVTKKFVKL